MELYDLGAEDVSPKMLKSLIRIYDNKIAKAADRYKERMTALQREHAAELRSLETTKESLKKLLNTYAECPECNGKGYITMYDSAWDDRGHSETCKACKGTGYHE